MFDELMISGDALVTSASSATAALAVRLPWYRSLPLSCVTGLTLSLDSEPVAAERLRLRLYGTEHRLEELAGLHDVFWFVLDEAELLIEGGGGLAGGSHEAELELSLRIPYPEFGTRHFDQVARCSKTVVVLETEGVRS